MSLLPLLQLPPASRARIALLPAGALRVRLASIGLVAGASVELVQATPAVVVRLGGTTLALEREIAAGVLVQLEEPRSS